MAVRRRARYSFVNDRSTSRRGDMMRPRPPRSAVAAPRTPTTLTPTPSPTAQSVVQASQGGALSGGVGGYDINSDPAVAAAHNLSAKIRAQAQASALAKRMQAAIEYGSAEGLQGTLGKQYGDTQSKAAANPFSVLSNMKHSYDTGLQGLEENLNNANLFYSGYRGQQLGEAARGYQQNQYDAANAYRGLLSDISDQLSQALLNADQMDMSALMGSSGGGYYDGGGGGDATRPTPPKTSPTSSYRPPGVTYTRVRNNPFNPRTSGRGRNRGAVHVSTGTIGRGTY